MDNINLKEDERIDDLEYKGLKLIQNKKGFCFGVDAVLLSDYAKVIKKGSTVVDIVTGTGIVAILLCAKTNLKKIYGIELQEEVANIAQRNVELNGLDDKMEVVNINIKDVFSKLEKNKIDLIVTNPPYKKHDTGVKNLDTRQLISRHNKFCRLQKA